MKRYLLDTDILISFSKNYDPILPFIQKLIDSTDEIGVCPINVAEFYAGIPPRQHPLWNTFFASLLYWPITQKIAQQAGMWRYEFARKGKILTTADTLIAAVAKEQNAILITGNAKDYPMNIHVYPIPN